MVVSLAIVRKLGLMQMNLPKILAQIHAEFGIYDSETFNVSTSRNIIYRISSIPELANLHQFYVDYQREYLTELQRRPNQHFTSKVTNVSKSVDLPFIGDAIIETGQAKYLFVFEGSLSPSEYLTVTVHSCLWPLDQHAIPLGIQSIFGKHRHLYDYRNKCLGINPSIARHSYVTDAVRIGKPNGQPDHPQNRQLLKREIEQLNPELVVLVGGTAAGTIGDEAESNTLYFKVPFPTKRRSKSDVEKANEKYEELRGRLSHNDSFDPTPRQHLFHR